MFRAQQNAFDDAVGTYFSISGPFPMTAPGAGGFRTNLEAQAGLFVI